MSDWTYGTLGQSLRGLGFTSRDNLDKRARIYEHAASGAAVYLPIFPDEQAVQPHHLLYVRGTLDQFGLPDPFAQQPTPQEAS